MSNEALRTYARRQKLLVFLAAAVGAFAGFTVLLILANAAGLKDWWLFASAVVGVAGGAATGWWYVLRRESDLPLGRGAALTGVISVLLGTPMLVLFYPLAWPAAGLAGLLTLQLLRRPARR